MFAFPRNGQNADQQLKDEVECYGMAKQRTGIDAQTPPPQGLSEEEKQLAQQQAGENAPKAQGGRVRGAARGAAGGAAIGAIAGDTGKGAAAGAVAGTMRGGMTQRSANAQSKQQAAAQTAAAQKKAEEECCATTRRELIRFNGHLQPAWMRAATQSNNCLRAFKLCA